MFKRKNIIKKLACVFAMGTLISTSVIQSTYAAESYENNMFTLTIMHTNNIHGNVDNLSKYSTIINEVRSSAKNVLVLDGGDLFLRGEFQEQQGLVETEILNSIGYDAWVPGNNDFRVPPSGGTIDDGNKQLKAITDKVEFDAVCANVTIKDTKQYIEDIPPYIIKDVNGVKVGIIGVTSLKPQTRKWTEVSDKIFEDGDLAVSRIVEELKGKTDVNIVLSHTGLVTDLKIANIEGVDAVLGADDHYYISEPMYYTDGEGNKSTPITQNGGENNHHLGRLDLVFEKNDSEYELVDFHGYLYDLNLTKSDSKIQNIIDQYRSKKTTKSVA